jgi:hypothetical protein
VRELEYDNAALRSLLVESCGWQPQDVDVEVKASRELARQMTTDVAAKEGEYAPLGHLLQVRRNPELASPSMEWLSWGSGDLQGRDAEEVEEGEALNTASGPSQDEVTAVAARQPQRSPLRRSNPALEDGASTPSPEREAARAGQAHGHAMGRMRGPGRASNSSASTASTAVRGAAPASALSRSTPPPVMPAAAWRTQEQMNELVALFDASFGHAAKQSASTALGEGSGAATAPSSPQAAARATGKYTLPSPEGHRRRSSSTSSSRSAMV